jgi:hypothetical protein
MYVEIGTETPNSFFWEYLFPIFGILSLQCICQLLTNNPLKSLLIFVLQAQQKANFLELNEEKYVHVDETGIKLYLGYEILHILWVNGWNGM